MVPIIHGRLVLATSLLLLLPVIGLVPCSFWNSPSSIPFSRTSFIPTSLYYTSDDRDENRGTTDHKWEEKIDEKRGRTDQKWDEMVSGLRQYRNKHGHTMVRPSDDPKLHQWIKNIRNNYRHQYRNDTQAAAAAGVSSSSYRSRLTPAKWETLQELDFCWEPGAFQWDSSFRELCQFQDQFGHCHTTRRDYRKDYPKLCNFVQNQRREYKFWLAGNRTQLSKDRIQRLNSIGMEWFKSHEMVWEKRYHQLEQIYTEDGNCHVPQGYSNNPQLGNWCMNQRTAYRFYQKGEQTALTQERIDKLKALNFQWHYKEYRWMDKFERLKAYQAEHSDFSIPYADTKNADLRIWLTIQRLFYHRRSRNESHRMTDQRIELLESIPDFSWRGREVQGVSTEDWSQLFVAIREKGISKPKQHWFDGMDPFEKEVKNVWTEDELVDLWNEEDDDDDDDDVYEDEQTRNFLQSEGP